MVDDLDGGIGVALARAEASARSGRLCSAWRPLALAWRVPWPPGAILLIDLGTLPAITIIGAGAYVMFASLEPIDHPDCRGRGPVRSRRDAAATLPVVRTIVFCQTSWTRNTVLIGREDHGK